MSKSPTLTTGSCVLCSNQIRTLIAIVTLSFRRLILGKVETAIYGFVATGISRNVITKQFMEKSSYNHADVV